MPRVLAHFAGKERNQKNLLASSLPFHRPFLESVVCVCIIDLGTERERRRSRRRASQIASNMYPRIKVREQEDQTIKEEELSFVMRIIETLSTEVQPSLRNSAANYDTESGKDPLLWHAKFHKSPLKGFPASSISASKGKDAKIINEDNKTKKRASSVPRPRAVLSSPDNDDLIGKQNLAIKRQTLPKIKSINQSLQAQGKEGSHKNAGVGTPLCRKGISKESGDNNHANERKLPSEVAAQRQVMFVKRG
ncbi:hypothetical protein C4D60_Mb01t23210 [Musa balbisiana]|uniref:Uncharacterized protein n=1 Tax=Musa balbisiana TaxID=52838 RepID=A0A4S8JP87_MUSBA|nr:hypothetical protein C4D60_Mb01t23210 [Musa balbisiana]